MRYGWLASVQAEVVAGLRLDLIQLLFQLGNRSHVRMDSVAGQWCLRTPPAGTDPGGTMREAH